MGLTADELGIEKKTFDKARKSMLYWSMGSMSIFFSGFCSYYMVMNGNSNWLVFELPDIFYISTAVIIASSLTMFMAQNAVKKNNYGQVKIGLLITLILGVAFSVLQFKAWNFLIANNIFFSGKGSNISGSILYVITFLHFLHIAAGIITLLVSLFKANKKRYSSDSYLGLSLTAIFWHFLDILWVVLFLFLALNR
jgi:cytochrome c oxidase subunit 3